MRWEENVTRIGKIRNAYNILVGESEVNRQLGGSRHREKPSIETDIVETRYEVTDWIKLSQERL
jgi:hypothetical protein